ncbi:MAG: HAMP domain-containing histidine kinase [Deltaproteobacteria bacterium]|nr:MAG: HAMP domain-containing histidine kinase [Deltaproteobacteria bacterium]
MKFSTKLFLAIFSVCFVAILAATFGGYEISKRIYIEQYKELYHQRLRLVAREFVAFENAYQRVALNAALAIRSKLASNEIKPSEVQSKAKELGVDGARLMDRKESNSLLKLCPAYKEITKNRRNIQQTPLLPDVYNLKEKNWFTLIPTKDLNSIINVRVNFEKVSQILHRLADDESDIINVKLTGPTGILLGQVQKTGIDKRSLRNVLKISETVPATVSDCCECEVRKLVSHDQPYTYKFQADISLNSLTTTLESLQKSFVIIISVLFFTTLLFSRWVSSFLLKKINLIRKTVDQIAETQDFTKRVPISENINSKDELNALAVQFNNMSSSIMEAQNSLIEAKKSEARAAIASQVAHDIRSPLTSMTLALNHLQEANRDKETKISIEEMISIMSHGISRVNGILKRLSKKYNQNQQDSNPVETPKLTLVDKLLLDVAHEHRLKLLPTQNFKIEGFESVPRYWSVVQVTELQTALSNILNNAFEASGDDAEVKLSASQQGKKLNVEISDKGSGIPQDIIEKVFEREFTSGKSTGSGLGLYQARKAIEWCGGKIQISSEEGKGTTVQFTIELEKEPKWNIQTLELRKGTTIHIADDDPSILGFWRQKFTPYNDDIKVVEYTYISQIDNVFKDLNIDNSLFILDQYAGESSQSITGLKLIEKYEIGERAILSTSEFDDQNIQSKIKELGAKLLPKPLLSSITIKILGTE